MRSSATLGWLRFDRGNGSLIPNVTLGTQTKAWRECQRDWGWIRVIGQGHAEGSTA
jgi:hypothetical protein